MNYDERKNTQWRSSLDSPNTLPDEEDEIPFLDLVLHLAATLTEERRLAPGVHGYTRGYDGSAATTYKRPVQCAQIYAHADGPVCTLPLNHEGSHEDREGDAPVVWAWVDSKLAREGSE